jgi:hypothetical protein
MSRTAPPGPSRLPLLAPIVVLASGAAAAVRLGLDKYFSIDELMHAQASWLTGRGRLPYRDFCDFHFPFLYQVLGALWAALPDDPGRVVALRIAMLALVALTLVAAGVVNRRGGPVAAVAGPAVLLTILPFIVRATEIRHDTLAFALFLSALSLLALDRPAPRVRGAVFGVLMGLAVWSSQKTFLYGAPVGALLAVGSLRGRRGGDSTFGSVRAAWAGGASVAAAAAIYLLVTGSWTGFAAYAVGWALRWQSEYPGFSPAESLTPLHDGYVVVLVLAAVGLGATVVSIRRKSGSHGLDLLLVLCLLSSLGSFLLLKAPYDYN